MSKNDLRSLTIEDFRAHTQTESLGDDLIIVTKPQQMPAIIQPQRLECLILGLSLKGRAKYIANTIIYEVKADQTFIISNGSVMQELTFEPDFEGIIYLIKPTFFEDVVKGVKDVSTLFLFSRNFPVCNIDKEEAANIQQYTETIIRKMEQPEHHFRAETIKSLMTALIYDISNAIYRIQNQDRSTVSRAEVIFTQYIKLVEKYFYTERRVSWYAQEMNITPKYLSETVKMVSHRTPNEWIDKYVIMELCSLLMNTTKTIKEIARDLNFPHQSFMGKYFKEHVGVSPSLYRRK